MKLKSLALFVFAALLAASSMADEPLGSWLSNLNQHGKETWQTGKLAGIADGYWRRIEADSSDYEARVLHAATIILQLGENKNVAAYAKKFGFTLDYLGMKVSGSGSAPSAWPKVNDMVDAFVKEGVPVLKRALADLDGIPSDWKGHVRISATDFPVDDDVYIDIGDVLYARAGIEAAIGLAYFAHGYDLTVDYAKGKAAVESRRTIQALPRAPKSEWDEIWESASDGAKCEGGLFSFKVGYVGKKMYIRVDGDMEGIIEDGNHAIRSIYLSMEDFSEEPCWGLLLTDDPAGCMQQEAKYTARVFNAPESDSWWYWDFSKKTVPVKMTQSDGACLFEIDLSKFATYAKPGTWSVGWGEVCRYTDWYEGSFYDEYFGRWYDGWWDCEWSHLDSLDDFPLMLYKLLTEQTKFMAKVRNQSSLSQSRSWMKTALNRALMADAAVRARPDGDENMHFVEYDPIDADAIYRARNLTEKALALLDAAQEIDVREEVFAGRETDFDLTLLPNDGVMQVYLGALFEGKITRDILPTFLKGVDEGPVPVMETVKDATFAGLLPEFTTKTWSGVLRELGREVVHQTIVVKLDGNGGQVKPGTLALDFDEEIEACCYPELPMPVVRKGYVFIGWATAKSGGVRVHSGDEYDASLFAGAKTPTLYAQWLKLQKLTLKDDSAYAEWWLDEEDFDPELYNGIMEGLYMIDPDFEGHGYIEGKGVMEVLPGARVYVSVDDYSYDKNGNELIFQKWTVTPSKADFGSEFQVTSPYTEFTMPDADVTLQATYIDESTCGRVYASAYANSVYIGYDYETGEEITIEPPYVAFEWSPDGGKTWYKTGYWEDDYWVSGEEVLLKKGSYAVTWRSTDPRWTVQYQYPTTKMTLAEGGSASVYAQFVYVPQVVVDVMTVNRDGELSSSSACGTVTMNPKDGLVPAGKMIALTAKAAKEYAFQGWALAKYWEYGDVFMKTAAAWKIENYAYNDLCGVSYSWLCNYINPIDFKVHVVAVFKAHSEYSADDIQFNGFAGRGGSYAALDSKVYIRAKVGCVVEKSLCCELVASPLTYKLGGKLPDGLKFDAKTGVISGVPKKVGKSTVTITASDPAKNSRNLTVNIVVAALPDGFAGEYRGSMVGSGYSTGGYWYYDEESGEEYYVDGEYVPGRQNGILEMTVKSDGKVSAKVLTRYGSRSVSGSLEWRDPDASYDEDWDDSEGYDGDGAEFGFWHTDAKDGSDCHVNFRGDGTIDGYVNSYDKKEGGYAGGEMTGLRQKADKLADSGFLDKYYTFAFCAGPATYDDDDGLGKGNLCEEEISLDEATMQSGYGYLTIKTDKKGGTKVTGQLPDGEKVSMSALVMPFACEEAEEIGARLYLFASPSAYKKLGWFAMTMTLNPNGTVSAEDGAFWTADGDSDEAATMFGEGALYSEAKTLEGYYWTAFCSYSDQVRQQYSYKEGGRTYYNEEYAHNFDDFLFNVAVKGDNKGSVSLVEKSPAPWVENGEWNYWEDKKGNEITDPSQLSISFAKATGIFTGKAMAYFDYPKPISASLPYAGVMISSENEEGEKDYMGFGAAVHTYKYSYEDEYTGKTKTETKKVSLPVSLFEGGGYRGQSL